MQVKSNCSKYSYWLVIVYINHKETCLVVISFFAFLGIFFFDK